MPKPQADHSLPHADIVVLALSSPIQIGIYQDNQRIETIIHEEKTSDILPLIFKNLLQQYAINFVYFAKGPGSFMAIKLVYVFLKTLQITQGIRLKATDGFYFTDNAPIKAVGKSCFIKQGDTIEISTTIPYDTLLNQFRLPQTLDPSCFSDDIEPLYILPAV